MAYFEDLSPYVYYGPASRPGTKNVGWLERGHDFKTAKPSQELLDRLWRLCKTSVVQMRGVHECEFCAADDSFLAERNGERLLLGSSEVRVFSKDGDIFAAPTLIYHYVDVHHYRPPDEFLQALSEGPIPPAEEYFDCLRAVGLEWNETSAGPPPGTPLRFRPS